MSGTRIGGIRAAAIKLAVDPDFYRRIGKLGGSSHSLGGFNDRELAKRAGAIGGKSSNRTGIKNGQGKIHKDSYQEVEGEA